MLAFIITVIIIIISLPWALKFALSYDWNILPALYPINHPPPLISNLQIVSSKVTSWPVLIMPTLLDFSHNNIFPS